jgi:hypothetical protein
MARHGVPVKGGKSFVFVGPGQAAQILVPKTRIFRSIQEALSGKENGRQTEICVIKEENKGGNLVYNSAGIFPDIRFSDVVVLYFSGGVVAGLSSENVIAMLELGEGLGQKTWQELIQHCPPRVAAAAADLVMPALSRIRA